MTAVVRTLKAAEAACVKVSKGNVESFYSHEQKYASLFRGVFQLGCIVLWEEERNFDQMKLWQSKMCKV